MTLRELLKLLNKIRKVHPEANDADVVGVTTEGEYVYISYVGFDKHYKHYRVLLEA